MIALAKRLAAIRLDLIYTSDLGRAHDTTEAVAAEQQGEVPCIATPDLRECDYGLWEGLNREEIGHRFKEDWENWLLGGRIGSPTGGESFLEVAIRAGRVFDSAAREGKAVLISAHGGPLQAILCHAMGIDQKQRSRFSVGNCSLSILETHPVHPPRLILLNDTGHLAGI